MRSLGPGLSLSKVFRYLIGQLLLHFLRLVAGKVYTGRLVSWDDPPTIGLHLLGDADVPRARVGANSALAVNFEVSVYARRGWRPYLDRAERAKAFAISLSCALYGFSTFSIRILLKR